MKIIDFSGTFETEDADQIADRLRSIRDGDFGAFYVAGASNYPYVAVHFNAEVAYLHYFPSDGHPGFQPTGMTPNGFADHVHFLNIDGTEGSAFDMPASTIVDAETAIAAVLEFATNVEMPLSIDWCEL